MSAETITVRRAAEGDGRALRRLRNAALKEHPDAFLASVAEEAENLMGDFDAMIATRWTGDANQMLVAEYQGQVVGMCGFYREERSELAHRATIWGLYVQADARHHHAGRHLLEHALEQLKRLPGVRQIHASITEGNTDGRRLYESLGFTAWGVQPGAMQVDGQVLDETHLILQL